MEMSFGSRLKHAWNAFTGNIQMNYRDLGMSYSYRADRPRMSRGNERSIVTSVYNRIALDVAALNVQHVRLDENGRFLSVIDDGLNNCLTLEANVDQTARSFIQDTKRWESNGVYHFRCSDTPQDDTWDCWCNYDRNNNQIDHFYTPIYFGSLVSGKLRSISSAANSVNTTAANEITYAKANGNDWYTEVLADRLLLQDLLVMMARSTECQTAFGYGRCKSSNSNAIAPGTMNTKGMFWGSNDQTSGVKVFGMENVWGNLWRRTAGWINANGTQKVKLTRGTHDGSTAIDYNTDGNGYKTIANATPAGSSGGYISSMKTEAFGRLPVTASGSSSTYEADGMWYNNSQVNYAYVGGNWNSGLMVGPFDADLRNAASHSGSHIGAALSCKPLAAA